MITQKYSCTTTKWLAALLFSLLAACGGGGNTQTAPPPPLQSAPPPAPPADITLQPITATNVTEVVGTQVNPGPSVRATNQTGAPVAGVSISFRLSGSGRVSNWTVVTGVDGTATAGTWTLGTKPGTESVTARSAGLSDVVFTATLSPGPPANLRLLGGNGQQAEPGATLQSPLRVQVTDLYSNPLGGVPVVFGVISGGGALNRSVAESDVNGLATSGAWTLGPVSSVQQVKAEAGNANLTFTAMACSVTCEQQPQELLFVRAGQIYVSNLLGTDARQLTVDTSRREDHPAWSPDGRRIAFVRDKTSTGQLRSGAELYLMNADGSNVSHRAEGFHSPAWSPDGLKLAVASGNCIYDCQIYLISVLDNGAAPVMIADHGADPTWSPDGSRIAFVRVSGDDGYHSLEVMNADGTGVKTIRPIDNVGSAIYDPSWSPDGSRIAFIGCDGACGVFTINPDGSALAPLTTLRGAFSLAWSPDGARIAVAYWPAFGQQQDTSIVSVSATTGGDPVAIVAPGYRLSWRR